MSTRQTPRRSGVERRPLGRYLLTYRTFAGTAVFVAREPVTLVSAQFLRAAGHERFAILAYCFMPAHVHLLVEGADGASDGSAFVARSRRYSGLHYAARTRRRLWERDSSERALGRTESSLEVSRYILDTPARTGLVTRASDYPFSGSFAWDRVNDPRSAPTSRPCSRSSTRR